MPLGKLRVEGEGTEPFLVFSNFYPREARCCLITAFCSQRW